MDDFKKVATLKAAHAAQYQLKLKFKKKAENQAPTKLAHNPRKPESCSFTSEEINKDEVFVFLLSRRKKT